jgi:ribonuclease BN (tRNA processing enzyme)
VTHADVCADPTPGRKVVLLGDTSDPSGIAKLAEVSGLFQDQDILIFFLAVIF